jgi:predicted nucleic acid-binding protein
VITAVDSNVLIDILLPGSEFLERSKKELDRAFTEGTIVVCEVVYAELAGQFSAGGLDRFLESTGVRLEPSTAGSLQVAGNAWLKYLSRKPEGMICTGCGRRVSVACVECKRPFTARQHLLSDFLIGAHAESLADRLLSRDRGYYRTYFPGLTVIDPSAR